MQVRLRISHTVQMRKRAQKNGSVGYRGCGVPWLVQTVFGDRFKVVGIGTEDSRRAVLVSGVEFAIESDEWSNGVFTYSVLEALTDNKADTNQDGQVTISELQAYVFDNVRSLTQGTQNPTSRQENTEFDWSLF